LLAIKTQEQKKKAKEEIVAELSYFEFLSMTLSLSNGSYCNRIESFIKMQEA